MKCAYIGSEYKDIRSSIRRDSSLYQHFSVKIPEHESWTQKAIEENPVKDRLIVYYDGAYGELPVF